MQRIKRSVNYIKALTLYEPWASLIGYKEKKIETRSWATKYRGRLAIHAAIKMPKWVKTMCPQFAEILGIKEYNGSWLYYLANGVGPFGKIVAVCTLLDCIEITPSFVATLTEKELAFGDYTEGRFAWILSDIKRLEQPIPAKGKQGLWFWEPVQVELQR